MPDSLKPDAQPWTIREQIIEDLATGLTFQFEVGPDGSPRMHVFGKDLPYGNRDFVFTQDGQLGATGTSTRGLCRPGWLTPVD